MFDGSTNWDLRPGGNLYASLCWQMAKEWQDSSEEFENDPGKGDREREREIYFQQFNMLVNASHTEGSPKNPLAGNLEMKESVLNSISLWRYLKSCCLTLIGRWMPGRGCGSRARRSSTSSSTVTAPSNSDAKSIPTEISSSKLDGDGFGYWRENCRWLIPIRLSISQKVPAGSKKLPTAIPLVLESTLMFNGLGKTMRRSLKMMKKMIPIFRLAWKERLKMICWKHFLY